MTGISWWNFLWIPSKRLLNNILKKYLEFWILPVISQVAPADISLKDLPRILRGIFQTFLYFFWIFEKFWIFLLSKMFFQAFSMDFFTKLYMKIFHGKLLGKFVKVTLNKSLVKYLEYYPQNLLKGSREKYLDRLV